MGEDEARRVIPAYLYHCNAHTPAGEAAFHRWVLNQAIFLFSSNGLLHH